MPRSKDFFEGWSLGWTTATQALLRSLEHLAAEGAAGGAIMEAVRLEAAANKPNQVARRRGRPRKTATAASEAPRRKRGRPPKAR